MIDRRSEGRRPTTCGVRCANHQSQKPQPVRQAAVAAVGDALREQGLAAPQVGGRTTFQQAKTAKKLLKAEERRIRLQRLRVELVERAQTETLIFPLAREKRDAWVTWPARTLTASTTRIS